MLLKSKNFSMLTMQVNGVDVKFATISDIAKWSGKAASTLRKMEELKILPSANFRTPDIPLSGGNTRIGSRLYSQSIADELARILKDEINRGIATTDETRQKLQQLFKDERLKYNLDA